MQVSIIASIGLLNNYFDVKEWRRYQTPGRPRRRKRCQYSFAKREAVRLITVVERGINLGHRMLEVVEDELARRRWRSSLLPVTGPSTCSLGR